jgi:hypothetical protein
LTHLDADLMAHNDDNIEQKSETSSEEEACISWHDITVRTTYIHVTDSFVQVLWLRYFCEYGPYTTYMNNSEIL